MTDNDHGIAGTAYGLVYGERAKTYGHPRIDFDIIANIWTGLLKDKLRDGERLDPYRVAVMMTGLKLARLVQSPDHTDSRIDTIGYMLTMERLDEVEDLKPLAKDIPGKYNPEDTQLMESFAAEETELEDSGHNWRAEAEREIDKLFGRETAGQLIGELGAVLRGFKFVNDIKWAEGDRLQLLNDSEVAWLYSEAEYLWFREVKFNPRSYSGFFSKTFRELRSEYSPLKVTTGTYKGLLLFKDGVGYVAE